MTPGNVQPFILPIAYSPDGRWLVSGNGRSNLDLWDADSGAKLATLTGHTAGIESVAVSPDGKWIASGSDDDTAKLWRRAR